MHIGEIKDEIRQLDRIDKIAICRWLEGETVDDQFVGIGIDRARDIRQEFEGRFNVTSPERQAAWEGRIGLPK